MAFPTFTAYVAAFGKVYNGVEVERREAIYNQAVVDMEIHNTDETQTYKQGVNQFTDLTLEEFQALPIRGYIASAEVGLPEVGVHTHNGETLATTVDWVAKGAVTPVKNQGGCGSCWAFSSTGATEGAWEIATGKKVSLSEQQLMDCSGQACGGGNTGHAFTYFKTTKIATEASYPYAGKAGTCKTSFTAAIPSGGVTGYKPVAKDATSLMSALNHNPVSVAIEADQAIFQHYTTGIITSGCGTNLDHAVVAVGYDSAAGYYHVKNSWGTSWGDHGYLKISTSGNVCGITSQANFPTVSGSVQV